MTKPTGTLTITRQPDARRRALLIAVITKPIPLPTKTG